MKIRIRKLFAYHEYTFFPSNGKIIARKIISNNLKEKTSYMPDRLQIFIQSNKYHWRVA